MSACVESVCTSTMMPEAVEARGEEGARWTGARELARAVVERAWMALAGPREQKAPPIAHVHVESFYAAVEQAENARLKGKAVLVVGGGVVASASAEAAGRGAVAGMTVKAARKACPNAIVIPGDYARYAEYAGRVRRILETYAPGVEMAACGSFYLDFSEATLPFSAFEAKLRRMQAEILGQTGMSVSIGAGTSRMVAALAAREHRPCGLRVVGRGEEGEFLAPFGIERLRGIAKQHVAEMKEGGLRTIGELQRIPKGALVAAFGAAVGHRLWDVARGREVVDFGENADVAGGEVRCMVAA